MPFLDLSSCLSLTFSLTFPLPFIGLSLPFLDLPLPSTAFPCPRSCRYSWDIGRQINNQTARWPELSYYKWVTTYTHTHRGLNSLLLHAMGVTHTLPTRCRTHTATHTPSHTQTANAHTVTHTHCQRTVNAHAATPHGRRPRSDRTHREPPPHTPSKADTRVSATTVLVMAVVQLEALNPPTSNSNRECERVWRCVFRPRRSRSTPPHSTNAGDWCHYH